MVTRNRKGEARTPREYQQSVRARLNELRARFHQSEIARRTHTPLTNVHRYMNTGKIPAEFCAALVEALEVNPAWLLAGAGGALLTEIDTGAAAVGSEMLTMVEAMDAVSRVRLGALAGKQQERTLRELSDNIGAYERLRERMDNQTRPVLAHLLKRYTELCNHMELERAGNVRRACLQVAKFCDDEELLWRLDNQQAMHEHLMGRVDIALQFHMKLFARKLREGMLSDNEACNQAGSLALALRDSGRFIEGRRITRAAIELTVEAARDTIGFIDLGIIAGAFDVELGDIRAGLAQLQLNYMRAPDRNRGFGALMLTRAELLAGLRSLADARAGTGYPSRGRSRLMLRHAALLENADEMKETRRVAVGQDETQVMPDEFESRRSAILLSALTNPKAKLLKEFDTLVRESPPPVNSPLLKNVVITVQRAQIARLVSSRREAGTATLAAQAALDAVPPDLSVTIELRAIQALNVLASSGNDVLKESSQAFLRDQVDRGYSGLRLLQNR